MSVSLMDIKNALAESKDPEKRSYGAWGLHDKSIDLSNGVMEGDPATALKEMLFGTKDNVPSPGFSAATGNNPYYTGPGSLFGVLGSESPVMSLRIQPRSISGLLPARPSRQMQPYFPYFTGTQADSGSFSTLTTPCADPPTAGPGKSGYLSAQFGWIEYQTRTVEVTRLGQQINRGEFWDLQLENSPILTLGGPSGSDITTPQNVPGNPQLMMEILMRMMEVGISFQNKLTPMVYTGNPTNNVGTGYAEFPGLDILIGTSQVDFFTGLPISALNSVVMNANSARIDDNAVNTVQMFTYMARNLKSNASRMNLDPVTWLIAMREDMFYELSAIWPCAYISNRCNPGSMAPNGQVQGVIDLAEQVRMRDDMRQGRYLLIEGERWPVVFDDGITERDGNNMSAGQPIKGDFSASVYFIPVTYMGGRAATYFEYFDWSGDFAAMAQMATQGIAAPYYFTDGGRYLWHWKGAINFCLQWLALIRPRIILHTPQLAGKIQNVLYGTPLHTREPFVGDPYFFNGGVSGNRAVQGGLDDWGTHTNPPN